MALYNVQSLIPLDQPSNPNQTSLSSPLSTSDAASSLAHATQATSFQAQLQPYSCLQCKYRKVKCDRVDPCANCRKAGAGCVYRAPPPPRGRRKRIHQEVLIERGSSAGSRDDGALLQPGEHVSEREQELLEKVRRYEDLLKGLGVVKRTTVDARDGKETDLSPRDQSTLTARMTARGLDLTAAGDGKLVAKYGKSRYLDNNLWMIVTDEFRDPKVILEGSSEDEDGDGNGYDTASEAADLIFPMQGIEDAFDLRSLHPQPMQIFMLWQAFVDNVNPLIKILHVPTTQKAILDAAADLSHVSREMEALLFGIYVITTSTVEEAQCQSTLQETKTSALNKFRIGAQQALRRAGVLKTSDTMVLQAFVLFLLSARLHYDAHTFWSLTGISIRIGQRIGLHRDGESLKLPPFQTEMRRRLWMNMVQLDSRAAELPGSGLSIMTQLWDTKPPLNVNDCDLYPDMCEPPTEHEKATETMFLLLRARLGLFLTKEMPGNDTFDGHWSRVGSPIVSMEEKNRAINNLEQILEEKFLRHADLQIPLHHFSSIIVKASVCKLRLFAHLPRNTGGFPSPSPSSTSSSLVDEDLLFTNSLQILQYDDQIRATKSLHRFLWHVEMHFQWHALIYLLTYLCTHASPNSRTETAWTTVDEIFSNHPEFIHGGRTRSKLCIAVSSLTLKAWEAREVELHTSNLAALLSTMPSCVKQLRGQRIHMAATSRRVAPRQVQPPNATAEGRSRGSSTA
ncbi:hypothetical protein AAE478_006865 [Parahypoxylon ruwenzoriense]